MDRLYFPQHRAERLIAIGRVLLVVFSLLAVWLDPSAPRQYGQLIYSLLALYLGYALLLMALVWHSDLPLNRLGLVSHIIDLPVFALFIYFTEGPASPFFVYLVFYLLCATLRWQWRGTLWSALAVLSVFVGMGEYAEFGLHDPAFEIDRFIIRSVHLVIVAAALAYLSAHEQRLQGELAKLAAWPRATPHPSLVQEMLGTTADILNGPRIVMIWEEPEEPWRYLAIYGHGECKTTREPPTAFEPLVAEPLAESNFFCLNTRLPSPTIVHVVANGWQHWQGAPLHPDLQARFAIASVLALNLRGENVQGRLFILDKYPMTSDDLILGEIVVRQITADMEQLYLQRRLQQAAATEERIRLTRELHDGLLQSLTGAALQLQSMHRLLNENPRAAAERLQDIQALIAAEQRDLRAFVQQLKPPPLGLMEVDSGLEVRLNELVKRIERQWDLPIEFYMEPLGSEIPQERAHALYRLLQEALVNAARHAQASSVRVQLGRRDDQLRITVADNGHGFPFHGRYDLAALIANQQGPESLKGRIASLGGDFIIDSSESGARLEITLPLP